MAQGQKIRVAVLFGGRSTEHEISIITALQVLDAFDSSQYETIPVYIDTDGRWYTGEFLRRRDFYFPSEEDKEDLMRVHLVSDVQSTLIESNPTRGLFSRKEPTRISVDAFFPAFHGSHGEDGCIQGMFEFIDAAYVGCGPRASAIAMNKHTSKQVLSTQGIPVLPDILLDKTDWNPNEAHIVARQIQEIIPLPVIVKPCNLGSSIAVSAATDEQQLMISLAGAFSFDNQVIVEPLLTDMYELNISVLYDGSTPRTSVIERPKREQESVLSFEQKYMKGNKKIASSTPASQGMASLKRDLDPADVPEEIKNQVRDYASRAFKAMDCRGVVRFDFMVDKKENKAYFNEINPLPGSFSYYLWEASTPRVSFTELLSTLVTQALEEHKYKKTIRRAIEPKIFKKK